MPAQRVPPPRSRAARRRIGGNFLKVCLLGCTALLVAGGCRSRPSNRVLITDYRSSGPPAVHFEDFNECFYRVDQSGLVDLVLRKVAYPEPNPRQQITQIIYVQSYWRPFPGRTHAEQSMLNANLSYVLLVGDTGVSYEGGGFFQYRLDADGQKITGRLEGADLQPMGVTREDLAIFERARVEGTFKAKRDDRRTTQLINRMNRLLGPLPRIEPESRGPEY